MSVCRFLAGGLVVDQPKRAAAAAAAIRNRTVPFSWAVVVLLKRRDQPF